MIRTNEKYSMLVPRSKLYSQIHDHPSSLAGKTIPLTVFIPMRNGLLCWATIGSNQRCRRHKCFLSFNVFPPNHGSAFPANYWISSLSRIPWSLSYRKTLQGDIILRMAECNCASSNSETKKQRTPTKRVDMTILL
jgi:hypothetical protein